MSGGIGFDGGGVSKKIIPPLPFPPLWETLTGASEIIKNSISKIIHLLEKKNSKN